MSNLTAIILTKNESINISDCINSIKGFATRIVVVDSGSDDDTVKLAKDLGAAVFYNKFINYSNQFNWALDNTNINTKWILRFDADERMTETLKKELLDLMEKNNDTSVNGIVLNSWLYFLGKRLRFGASNKRKLMVFKFGVGRIENRKMDEHTILTYGTSITAKNKYEHYDFKNIDIFVKKLNWYATREMQDYYEYIGNKKDRVHLNDKKIAKIRRRKFMIYYKLPLFFRSTLLFFYFYVIKLGFLDGKQGYVYNYLYTNYYRKLVDIKILEQKLYKYDFSETGDLK